MQKTRINDWKRRRRRTNFDVVVWDVLLFDWWISSLTKHALIVWSNEWTRSSNENAENECSIESKKRKISSIELKEIFFQTQCRFSSWDGIVIIHIFVFISIEIIHGSKSHNRRWWIIIWNSFFYRHIPKKMWLGIKNAFFIIIVLLSRLFARLRCILERTNETSVLWTREKPIRCFASN